MRLVRSPKSANASHSYVFQITEQEKDLLLATLKLYPMLETSHHKISKNSKSAETAAAQEWLEEAMEQQRRDHKKRLAQFFNTDNRFFKSSQGELRFTLTGEQMEWMLRILNEIRVGSWVRLGRPEVDVARRIPLTSASARLFAAMELSGQFQAYLLEAFS
jgi:hypothetical protein